MNKANHPQQPESPKNSAEQPKQQYKGLKKMQMSLRTLVLATALVPVADALYKNMGSIKDGIVGAMSAKERELTEDYTDLSSLDRSIEQKESIHIEDVPVGQAVCDADVVFRDAGNGAVSPRVILTFKGFPAFENGIEKHLDVAFESRVRHIQDENGNETRTFYPAVSVRNNFGDATQEDIQQLQEKVGQLSPSATNALQPLIGSSKNYAATMMDAGKRQQVCEQIVELALKSSQPNGLIAGGPGVIQQ